LAASYILRRMSVSFCPFALSSLPRSLILISCECCGPSRRNDYLKSPYVQVPQSLLERRALAGTHVSCELIAVHYRLLTTHNPLLFASIAHNYSRIACSRRPTYLNPIPWSILFSYLRLHFLTVKAAAFCETSQHHVSAPR
jgi:hypothetical protein